MDESLLFLKFAAKKTVTEGEVTEYDVPQLEHRPRIVFFRREEKMQTIWNNRTKSMVVWEICTIFIRPCFSFVYVKTTLVAE